MQFFERNEWYVAGYGTDDWWVDVEDQSKGLSRTGNVKWNNLENFTDRYIDDSEIAVVAIVDQKGELNYYTVYDLDFEDFDAVADYVDYLKERYGLGTS